MLSVAHDYDVVDTSFPTTTAAIFPVPCPPPSTLYYLGRVLLFLPLSTKVRHELIRLDSSRFVKGSLNDGSCRDPLFLLLFPMIF